MFVTPVTFERHLGWIGERFRIVRLRDWVASVRAGEPVPARACAITFDDGWRDNIEFALPALQRHAAPATLFAVSHLIGTNATFWPNRLARLLSERTAFVQKDASCEWLREMARAAQVGIEHAAGDEEARSRLIARCKELADDLVCARLDVVENAAGLPASTQRALLDWNELARMVASGLVDVGSHTRHHYRLREGLDPDIMSAEVRESRSRIASELARPVELFCYPNGDVSPAAASLVESEYAAAVTTRRGVNTPATPLNRLCRVGMHEDVSSTRHAFLARISGWI